MRFELLIPSVAAQTFLVPEGSPEEIGIDQIQASMLQFHFVEADSTLEQMFASERPRGAHE